jgi:hypothetical protein
MFAETLARRLPSRWTQRVAILLAAAVAVSGMWRDVREARDRPQEDLAGAMRYLRQNAGPQDLLLVHASNREGFRLYSAMGGWSGPRPVYGDTGAPCCLRIPSRQTDAASDIGVKVPAGYSGRVWLFYTTRPSHWDYVGRNEGEVWRGYLWEHGCPPGPYIALANLAISPMDCDSYRP